MIENIIKPQTVQVQLEHIPNCLKTEPRWVGWRWTFNPDKPGGHHHGWDKPLLSPKTGKLASSTDPTSWGTYEQAVDFMRRESLDGIGFNLLGYEDIVVHDLDDCRNPDTGEISPWTMSIVRLVGGYWEVTPSGSGLRGICRGEKPGPRVEASKGGLISGAQYDGSKGRYITLSGHLLPESTPDICDAHTGGIEAAYTLMFPPKTTEARPAPSPHSVDMDDAALLEKAKKAGNGDRFTRLWEGDISGYNSQSEADMALVSHLAFWTGGDPGRIDSLFRQSHLFRGKWDERHGAQTYGDVTITRALEGAREFYSNGQHANGRSPGGETVTPAPSAWEPPQPFDSVEVPDFPVDALPSAVAN